MRVPPVQADLELARQLLFTQDYDYDSSEVLEILSILLDNERMLPCSLIKTYLSKEGMLLISREMYETWVSTQDAMAVFNSLPPLRKSLTVFFCELCKYILTQQEANLPTDKRMSLAAIGSCTISVVDYPPTSNPLQPNEIVASDLMKALIQKTEEIKALHQYTIDEPPTVCKVLPSALATKLEGAFVERRTKTDITLDGSECTAHLGKMVLQEKKGGVCVGHLRRELLLDDTVVSLSVVGNAKDSWVRLLALLENVQLAQSLTDDAMGNADCIISPWPLSSKSNLSVHLDGAFKKRLKRYITEEFIGPPPQFHTFFINTGKTTSRGIDQKILFVCSWPPKAPMSLPTEPQTPKTPSTNKPASPPPTPTSRTSLSTNFIMSSLGFGSTAGSTSSVAGSSSSSSTGGGGGGSGGSGAAGSTSPKVQLHATTPRGLMSMEPARTHAYEAVRAAMHALLGFNRKKPPPARLCTVLLPALFGSAPPEVAGCGLAIAEATAFSSSLHQLLSNARPPTRIDAMRAAQRLNNQDAVDQLLAEERTEKGTTAIQSISPRVLSLSLPPVRKEKEKEEKKEKTSARGGRMTAGSTILSSAYSSVLPDFPDSVQPSDTEKKILDSIAPTMEKAKNTLKRLVAANYSMVPESVVNSFVRALSSAHISEEEEAWDGVTAALKTIMSVYQIAKDLSEACMRIVEELARKESVQSMSCNQALVSCMMKILEYLVMADIIKSQSKVQNTLSYYRRAATSRKMCGKEDEEVIKTEDMNAMTIFYSVPAPALGRLRDDLVAFCTKSGKKDDVMKMFSLLGNVSMHYAEKRSTDIELCWMLSSCIIACIIVCEHLCGATEFKKCCTLQLKECMQAVRRFGGCDTGLSEKKELLLNLLRCTTLLTEADTSKAVHALIMSS